MAESRGKIAHDFRVFFMGHKGSMEARYATNKGILPSALVGTWKSAFRDSKANHGLLSHPFRDRGLDDSIRNYRNKNSQLMRSALIEYYHM